MRIFLTLILSAIIGLPIFAQDTLSLNMEKSIDLALKQNYGLRQAKLDQKIADERVTEAYGSALFPTIDGNVRYNRAIKREQIIIETPAFSGSFPAGTKNTLSGSVSVEQPLFTGAMFLAVKIAKTYKKIAERQVDYSKIELVMNVKEAFYTYQLAKDLVELSRLQLKRAEENLDNVRSMYNAGLTSEFDFTKANVQYQNTLPAVTESENQLQYAAGNLKLLLGLDYQTEIKVTDTLNFQQKYLPGFEEGLMEAYKNNKLLDQLQLDVEMKNFSADYEFTQHFPKINAFGNWRTQAQENDDRAFDEWRYKNSLSVGVTMSVPIFNGFQTSSKVQQAELEVNKAEAELAKQRQQLKINYNNIYTQIIKNEEQTEAYKAAMKQSDRGYEISVKRFNNGLGTQLEVTNAALEYSNARVNYLRSLLDYYISHARLDLIQGKSIQEISY